jgi:NAD(P)H-flavin reductase
MELEVLKDKKVTLYYGAQTPDKMAYKARLDEWKALGVDVVCAVSEP